MWYATKKGVALTIDRPDIEISKLRHSNPGQSIHVTHNRTHATSLVFGD